MNSSFKKTAAIVSSIFTIFLIAYLISLFIKNQVVFPNPLTWFESLFKLLSKSDTYLIIFYTFLRLIYSLVISFIIGVTLGLIAIKFTSFHYLLKPFFYLFRSIPLISIILIVMVLADLNKSPNLITILFTIPIIYDGVYEGIKCINKDVINAVKLDSKCNFNTFKKIYIPLSWPNLKNSIINSISLGIKVLIMSEFICGTTKSIGNQLMSSVNNLEYSLLFAWTIIIIFLVFVINSLAKLLNLTIKYRTIK